MEEHNEFLDIWGDLLGEGRYVGESDENYARRLIKKIREIETRIKHEFEEAKAKLLFG
jgi:hypothetical protein